MKDNETVYDPTDYTHYRIVNTGQLTEINRKTRAGENVKKFITEEHIINYDDVMQIDLDNVGINIRTNAHDYILTDKYLIRYWLPILGANAVMTYQILLGYCIAQDFVWHELSDYQDELGVSRPTLNKALDILEEHAFILRVWRKNNKNENCKTSPLIKVRQYIPLLSEELVDQLPKRLKESHAEYIEKKTKVTTSQEKGYASNMLNQLLENATIAKKNAKDDYQHVLLKEGNYTLYLLNKLTPQQLESAKHFEQSYQGIMERSVFETWFSKSVMYYDEEKNTFYGYFKDVWSKERFNLYSSYINLFTQQKYGKEPAEIHTYSFENLDPERAE
ncbi:hypothetical protein [Bacillus wiedmannii]|uniref:hypothetical protein n=1 Tax=Bacillus wiedmannii TaxID=1890302 RepID=UPI003D25041D